MKFKINHTPSNDFLIIEAKSIEECTEIVTYEIKKRGWKIEDCWSKKL